MVKKISSDPVEDLSAYKSLFKDSYAIKLIIDPDTGTILDASRAALSFYRYAENELTGMNISQINVLSEKNIKKEMEAARRQHRNYFNFRHRLKTGKIKDVEVYSGPIKFKNKEVLYSIIHDITERKQAVDALKKSERTIRTMINATGNLVYLLDRKGIIINLNMEGARLFDRTPGDMMGKGFDLFFTDNDFSRIRMMVNEAIRTRTPVNYQRNRKGKYLDINLYPVFNEKKKVDMICVFVKDITDLKKTEKVFAAIETAGGICHEMNQPLQVLLGSLEILKLNIKDDDTNAALINKAILQTEKLGLITKQLTRITRYETKQYLKGTIFDIEKSSGAKK